MWVSCILRSGLLFVTLSLAIAKQKQSPFAESCYPRGTLSQAVDTLYVKAASLRATIPEDRIKNIRLLKKKTKKLFMKNCRFQEQLLSFFMEDVFGQLQLQVCKEMHFVEEFHSLRQKLSRCVWISSFPGLVIPGPVLSLDIGQKRQPQLPISQEIMRNSFENALSQFQRLSDFDRCHEGGKQEDAEGWRLGAVSQISCASSTREMKSITRMKRTFYEIGKKGIYKAISELDILLSWIKQFLESIK